MFVYLARLTELMGHNSLEILRGFLPQETDDLTVAHVQMVQLIGLVGESSVISYFLFFAIEAATTAPMTPPTTNTPHKPRIINNSVGPILKGIEISSHLNYTVYISNKQLLILADRTKLRSDRPHGQERNEKLERRTTEAILGAILGRMDAER